MHASSVNKMQTTEYKSGSGKQLSLHELKTIAEWIVDVDTIQSGDGVVVGHFDVVSLEPGSERRHVEDANSRMRFGGGREIHLHADMQLMHAALQPDPSARLQRRWFSQLGHGEY